MKYTLSLIMLMTAVSAPAQDWPQFHGPYRNNKSLDTGLLKAWPEGGPTRIWEVKGIGEGYSTVSIVGDRIYTAGAVGEDCVITAMDLDGSPVWTRVNGKAWKKSYPGTRSTPTVVEGLLYHLSGIGNLICVKADTGETVWSVDILEKFNGRNIIWGLSESPLVVGDLVICTPGAEDVSMVALNRHTGELVWQCKGEGDRPGYASPILVDYKGLKQIVTGLSESIIGVRASDGKLLWRFAHKVYTNQNILTPIFHDGYLIVSGCVRKGTRSLKLEVSSDECAVKERWHNGTLDNKHGGIVLVDGQLYGYAESQNKDKPWMSIDFETGDTIFQSAPVESSYKYRNGCLTYADNMFYLYSDDGDLALATPNGFEVTGRLTLEEPGERPTWAFPVVHNGRLYVRYGDRLAAYDVSGGATPVNLTCEYLRDPVGIGTRQPRLAWQLPSGDRGLKQTAYQLLVASNETALAKDAGDLWDTGRTHSPATAQIAYSGKSLKAGQSCFWKVRVWDQAGEASDWSQPAQWSVGLETDDWQAEFISFRDTSPVHKSRGTLYLPPARHYRKQFRARGQIKRATIHATALGIFDLYLNGRRVCESYFAPGWSDYRKRAYTRAWDVTDLLAAGDNAIGAIVADGWYAGYVGYGVLVGYGPYKSGRCFYGKTPSVMAQLEMEYEDGSRQTVVTDRSWKVTGSGPLREADIQGGETYDARLEMPGWCQTGFDDSTWDRAILASENGEITAPYSDRGGPRQVELGFVKPEVLQPYSAQPIMVTEELPAQKVTEFKPGVYIFDLGENFAGVIRLKTKGPAGTKVVLRYGEMLHPDGRLMTENLRKARCIDTYILKGDPQGEQWVPRFTYHGFQFVEVTGLPEKPTLDTVTGLVLTNDTPMTSGFECSDPVINQLFKNITRTQKANFVELPTDCPQRDERMGWMGDAQIYVRSATINADVSAFFTKWLDDVDESQRPSGAYPDYAPYPMQHGGSGKSFGTAWMDAGIICPWTIWKVYGDTRVIERHWDSMSRFMAFRKTNSPDFKGISLGNTWGDWLNVKDPTPIEFVDACYFARTAQLMAEMGAAIGKTSDAAAYRDLHAKIKAAFADVYLEKDGTLNVQSQTAHVLALAFDLLTDKQQALAADALAKKIAQNDFRMTTGFLGTKEILPVLSQHGHHGLAVRLFQSRRFPSWGYEVVNGATSIWERWDSYTKEDGFGRHNAAMNSFSHYAFGAVCEWMFRTLAGIDSDTAGFNHILLHPMPPSPGSNPDQTPVHWVKAHYDSIHGRISSAWKLENNVFTYDVTVPANTTATVFLPCKTLEGVTESGQQIEPSNRIMVRSDMHRGLILEVGAGTYAFACQHVQ